MRQYFRHICGLLAIGLMSCLGFGSVALAGDLTFQSAARYAAAQVGSYGYESAKVKAELAHSASYLEDRMCSGTALTTESNGFRMTSLIKPSMPVSEVAKGTSGSKTLV